MKANYHEQIPDEVELWEKFEYEPLENLIEHFYTLEEMYRKVYEEATAPKVFIEIQSGCCIRVFSDKKNLGVVVYDLGGDFVDEYEAEMDKIESQYFHVA